MSDFPRPAALLLTAWLLAAFHCSILAQSSSPEQLLPWEQNRLSDRVIPFSIANSTTAKQMLEISGIGDSQLRFFIDEEPVAGKDIDTTGYILRQFHQFDTSNIKRWSSAHTLDSATLLPAFLETPDDYRIDFYRIRGKVIRIQRQPIVEEAARLIGFRSFFWVWMKPYNSDIPIRIATRKLPIAWFPDEWKTIRTMGETDSTDDSKSELAPDAAFELSQPAAADGLFLKVAAEQDVREIVMAAPRVEWLPERASPEQRINAGVALLSQFEFDAGLLDDLRRSNGKAMNRADTEAFFQILSILNQPTAREAIGRYSLQQSIPRPTVSNYLQNTRELQGQLVTLQADVRQITKVAIRNDKMQHRLGFDHYWQLDAFVYLGEEAIELKTNETDQDGLVYKNRYPVQICLIELPTELQQAQSQLQQGTYRSDSLHEDITIQGFFFKLWTYQSARTIGAGDKRVQLSPLFIASAITVHPPHDLTSSRSSLYLGIGFVIMLIVVTSFLLRVNRADDGFRKHTETTRHAGGIDSNLLADAEEMPDQETES